MQYIINFTRRFSSMRELSPSKYLTLILLLLPLFFFLPSLFFLLYGSQITEYKDVHVSAWNGEAIVVSNVTWHM